MKKLLFAACLIAALSLLGCAPDSDTPQKPDALSISDGDAVITITSEIPEADIWILPDTEANRKTTLWGTATIPKQQTNETKRVSLTALGGEGAYLLRVIDKDSIYYSANDVSLKDGVSLRLYLSPEAGLNAFLEICDASGAETETVSVFAASL